MNEELTYALITPYSLYKSRTGGIIGRMLAHANLDLVDVRMFILSDEFVDRYIDVICPLQTDPVIGEAWRSYLDRNLRASNSWHYAPRCMVLLFSGPDAVRHLREDVIGSFTEAPLGDTIRGTFGDFIRAEDGHIHYFEPAVITAPVIGAAVDHLRLLARHAHADGGVLTGTVQFTEQENIETTLVLIKPDDFERRSRKPGNVIDVISRTGLKIVGARLLPMTAAMGEKLYGPMRKAFATSLKGGVTQQVYSRLHGAFAFPVTMHDAQIIADMLSERNAAAEFNRIVQYMTGVNPDEVTDAAACGGHCLAMLYQGPDAISKVQAVLGGSDPTRLTPIHDGSDFARNLMRNGAHSSTSADEAMRERRIVGLDDEQPATCRFETIITEYLSNHPGAMHE